jgi:hypothetical protein
VDSDSSQARPTSRIRQVLFSLIAIVLVIFLFLIIAEVFLRIVPIPGIRYDVSRYDTLTGSGFYPNTVNFYRNDRGDFVKRRTNKWGYFDKGYKKEKRDGITRIGFFGDSFTQAIQVPLEETFHYLIGDSLKTRNVESLSFGVSGFSTYLSYLTYQKWANFFDIDEVVYVFYENDIGDQIKEIKKYPNMPYPYIEDNQLKSDHSFVAKNKYRTKFYYRFYDYLTSKFLVIATISERLKLLTRHGVMINVNEEDRYLRTNEEELNRIKYPPELELGDNPSVWPDSIKDHATQLAEKIILEWRDDAIAANRKFYIIYTPKDITNPTFDQDTWKPWIVNFCMDNNIILIDPTSELNKMERNGNEVFYDHYTGYGHAAVTNEFIRCWINKTSSPIDQLF